MQSRRDPQLRYFAILSRARFLVSLFVDVNIEFGRLDAFAAKCYKEIVIAGSICVWNNAVSLYIPSWRCAEKRKCVPIDAKAAPSEQSICSCLPDAIGVCADYSLFCAP